MEKKLSELIREGAKRYPMQAFGCYVNSDIATGFVHSACALGGVALVLDPRAVYDLEASDVLYDLFDDINLSYSEIPEAAWPYLISGEPEYLFNIKSVIAALNDGTRWTREQIADWVESIGH